MNVTPATDTAELCTAIARLCAQLPTSIGSAGLASELSRLSPLEFRNVLTRGGWYRPSGVVDRDGQRVAPDLVAWGDAELARHDGDVHAWCEANAGSGLRATRFVGCTHYLVAVVGPGPADFVQLEIEELQEVCGHALFDVGDPGSLEEVLDPPSSVAAQRGEPLGQPFFTLRRLTDVAAFVARMRAQRPEKFPVNRFIDAWQASSAAAVAELAHHWVFALRETLGAYRQPILQASPIAALNGVPPRFGGVYGARGLPLAGALHAFDRAVGHPMAWFFHMLTTKSVPHAVAQAVIEDSANGFAYLPERDVGVLKDWLHKPYAF